MIDSIRIQNVLSEVSDIYLVKFGVLTCLNSKGSLIGILTENVMARWSDSPLKPLGKQCLRCLSHIQHLIYVHGYGLGNNNLGKLVLTEGIIEFLLPTILFIQM